MPHPKEGPDYGHKFDPRHNLTIKTLPVSFFVSSKYKYNIMYYLCLTFTSFM